MEGKTVGSYKITGKLGEGGMGAVYRAEHSLMNSQAAVKVLLPEYSNNKEVVDRFFNEAKAATMVHHPGIVKIFDFGYADDGSAFIVMELLRGDTLSDRMKHGALKESEVVRVVRQAARALSCAHNAGIIHRDLKPENFVLVQDAEVAGGERVKLLDFGIAKLMGAQSAVKTRAGAAMGTPMYMAPEQCRGAMDLDQRADIYALGCVAFHMICGRPPFGGVDTMDMLAILGMHVYEPAPMPHTFNPEISTVLEQTIVKMLAKDPDERFQTMDEVVEQIDGLSAGRFQTSPPMMMSYDSVPPPAGASVGAASTRVLTGGPTMPAPAAPAKSDTTTTLGSAISIIPNPRSNEPRSSRRWLGAGVALAAAGGLAIALLGGGASAESGAESGTAAKPAPPPVERIEPAPTPSPAPVEPEPVAMVEMSITSTPEGADVFRAVDGVKVGITPYTSQLERGEGELVLILKHDGFEPARVAVPLAQDTVETVALVAEPKARPSKKKPNKRRDKRKWGDLMD